MVSMVTTKSSPGTVVPPPLAARPINIAQLAISEHLSTCHLDTPAPTSKHQGGGWTLTRIHILNERLATDFSMPHSIHIL